MLVFSAPSSLLASYVAVSAAVVLLAPHTSRQLNNGAAAFSIAALGHGTVSQRSLRRVAPGTSGGFPLRSNASQDGEGPGSEDGSGDYSPGSSAAEEDGTDSLLGGQALQALEFWKSRIPSPTLPSTQVIGLLMAALQKNDDPAQNDGLRTVFEFSSGMCRRAVGGSADSFIKEARNSVFGAAVGCRSFELEPMNMVGDRLATQVVSVVASDGRRRRFLWTLELQRRPPDAGKWLIYGVLSSDVDGMLTMEG